MRKNTQQRIRQAKKRRAQQRTLQHLKEKPFKRSTRPKALEEEITYAAGVCKKNTKTKRLYWHIYYKNVRAGHVSITSQLDGQQGQHSFIDIKLNQQYRGQGIGSLAFRKACEMSDLEEVYATIRKGNISSRIAAERAGFMHSDEHKGCELTMIWKKNPSVSSSIFMNGSRLYSDDLRVIVPRKSFLTCNSAMDMIFDLLPDKYPVLTDENNENWAFELGWPRHLLEHIDSNLANAAKRNYNIDLCQLADYVEIKQIGKVDFVFSMFHSKAIIAPILAAQRNSDKSFKAIIHVDAHRDLSDILVKYPCLSKQSEPISDIEFDLKDTKSIYKAIEHGVIHKGNFLSAFIANSSPGYLFNIYAENVTKHHWIKFIHSEMEMSGIDINKISLIFESSSDQNMWQLADLPNLPEEIILGENDMAWLDVDLDAFCNRFNGDSDHRDIRASGEEKLSLENRIEAFLLSLKSAKWKSNVRAVSVAASPGFFPSEYWNNAISRICYGILNTIPHT